MTQILFQDNAQAFAHQATSDLIDFLTGGNANANLNYLSDFIQSLPTTFRDSALDVVGMESLGSYPIVYLASTTTRSPFHTAKSLHAEGRTDFTIWDSQPNPVDATTRCMAVTGAIASMIKQTMFDESATDWRGWYSNAYPDGIVVNQVTCPGPPVMETEGGLITGRCHTTLTAFWVHYEALV